MHKVNKSLKRFFNGNERSFPTYEDLVNYLTETGDITQSDELLGDKRNLLRFVLFYWIRLGQLACRFARRLAKKHEQVRWISVVADFEPDMVAHLQPVLELAEREYEAISIIVPRVVSAEEVCRLIEHLCADPQWHWEEIPWEDAPPARWLLVGLRWRPTSGDYTSWVLGFGPFETMPFTRRPEGAPFTALVFRPTPPTFEKEKRLTHLAHMPHLLPNEEAYQRADRNTREDKEAFLGGRYEKAVRARVTFCLPFECRELLPPAT